MVLNGVVDAAVNGGIANYKVRHAGGHGQTRGGEGQTSVSTGSLDAGLRVDQLGMVLDGVVDAASPTTRSDVSSCKVRRGPQCRTHTPPSMADRCAVPCSLFRDATWRERKCLAMFTRCFTEYLLCTRQRSQVFYRVLVMYQAGPRVDLVMHQAEIPGVLQSTCYVPGGAEGRPCYAPGRDPRCSTEYLLCTRCSTMEST